MNVFPETCCCAFLCLWSASRTGIVTHLDRMTYLCKPVILLQRTIRYACYEEAMKDRVTADHFSQGLTSLRNRKSYKMFKDDPVI